MLLAASPLGRQAACLLLSARSVCDASYSCGLLARLQSHFSASTSSSPPTAIGQAPGGSSLQQSASSHAEQQQACSTGDHQQQQHHTPHAWSSSRSWCFSATRGYADDASSSSSSYARMGRRRRLPSQHTSNSSTSSFPQQQQQQQQLGRVAALCQPTERLREAAMLDDPSYNPYADNRPELLNPRQVNGSRGEDLDNFLLMRQQVENSRLPSELKRSALIGGPHWDQLLLHVNRTVKVTKGGKVETLHAMVAVGNADGLIGIGEHSGKNIQKVTMDAQLKAYRNLVAIPRYREHTVFHPIDVKNRKIRMRVWPRLAGFGLTASPLITSLCDLVGIRDATFKVTGRRRNIRNVVYTFIDALLGQSLPHDGVEGSGVYMREVYYAKQLPCGLKRGVHVP